MEMHSRKGTLADIERLVEIEESAGSGGYYLYDNRHFYFDGILNKGEMVVALNEEEHPVGIGQYSILPDGSGWLECLRVEKQWQSQGAGKAIYRRYMALAEETNAPSVAMFTGRKNLASKGLAEKHGFHLAAAYMGYDLALPGAVKEIVTGFHLVVDEEEAVKLLTQAVAAEAKRAAETNGWGTFMAMNRTFFHYGEPLYRYLHRNNMVFTDGENVLVLGARMLRARGLHVGFMAGDYDKCLAFAASATAAQGLEKLSIMFPPERADLHDLVTGKGYAQTGELIVMELDRRK